MLIDTSQHIIRYPNPTLIRQNFQAPTAPQYTQLSSLDPPAALPIHLHFVSSAPGPQANYTPRLASLHHICPIPLPRRLHISKVTRWIRVRSSQSWGSYTSLPIVSCLPRCLAGCGASNDARGGVLEFGSMLSSSQNEAQYE